MQLCLLQSTIKGSPFTSHLDAVCTYVCMSVVVWTHTYAHMETRRQPLAQSTDAVHLFFSLFETGSLTVLGVIQLGRWACRWAPGSLLSLPVQHLRDCAPAPPQHTQGRHCLAVCTSASQALGTELQSTLVLVTFFFSVLWIIIHVNEWLSIPLPSLGLPQMHMQEINKQKEN